MKAILRVTIGLAWIAFAHAAAAQDPTLAISLKNGAPVARAQFSASVVRVVWETTADVAGGGWSAVAVRSPVDRMSTYEPAPLGSASPVFVRARVYETPGFNARLGAIVEEVRGEHPDATLLEASPILGNAVEELPDGSTLRAVFAVPGGTVTAQQADPSSPAAIEFVPQPWLGDQHLPWPIATDLEVAESLRRNAGYGPEYRSLTLRQPVYPGMVEPYFIFGTPGGGFVFVGTESRKVFVGN